MASLPVLLVDSENETLVGLVVSISGVELVRRRIVLFVVVSVVGELLFSPSPLCLVTAQRN